MIFFSRRREKKHLFLPNPSRDLSTCIKAFPFLGNPHRTVIRVKIAAKQSNCTPRVVYSTILCAYLYLNTLYLDHVSCADDRSKCSQNVSKMSNLLNIITTIWNHHEGCTQTSTNMHSLWFNISETGFEMALRILIQKLPRVKADSVRR